jgi:hypothetical protein
MVNQPDTTPPPTNAALSLAGAAAGGVLGYLAFGWLAGQGFYALALPGVLLGLGAGVLARRRSMAMAVVCGVLALLLGIFSEWKHFPFARDDSLNYFLAHVFDLRPLTWIMLGLGAFSGFWFARPAPGRRQSASGEDPVP